MNQVSETDRQAAIAIMLRGDAAWERERRQQDALKTFKEWLSHFPKEVDGKPKVIEVPTQKIKEWLGTELPAEITSLSASLTTPESDFPIAELTLTGNVGDLNTQPVPEQTVSARIRLAAVNSTTIIDYSRAHVTYKTPDGGTFSWQIGEGQSRPATLQETTTFNSLLCDAVTGPLNL